MKNRHYSRFENEDVWLSQQQMAELYQTSRTNVVEHFEEGELTERQPVGISDSSNRRWQKRRKEIPFIIST
jgi:hypothetical protein